MNELNCNEALIADADAEIDRWISARNFKLRTQQAYRRELHRCAVMLGKPLSCADAVDLRKIADDLSGRPRATAARILSTVRSFCGDVNDSMSRRAIAAALRAEPPVSGSVVDLDRPRPGLLQSSVVRMIALSPKGRDKTLLRAIYEVPLLPSEAVDCRWGDVHLIGGQPEILIRRSGATEALRLRVPLYAELIRMRNGASDGDPLFDLSERQIRRVVMSAGDRVGLKNVTPRDLRDAHAVHASENGAPDVSVKRALGVESLGRKRTSHVRRPQPSCTYLPSF